MVLGHDLSQGQRTQDVRISENVSFDTMLLRSETLKGLKKAGFLKPSPIQLHGIPLGKCGFDLLLEAKSGTGKTAVFTAIALEKLELNKGLQAIILAPTREIASQISAVITEIGSQYKGLNVAVVMGGLPIKQDIEKFNENVHIVVGSPGRLRHLVHGKHIDVSSARLFVLDEADKLMERVFQPDINYIFSRLPKQKQVIMSTATYSEETKIFISKYVQKAQQICPDSNCVLLGIKQKVTIVPYNSNIVKQTKYRYEELKKILNERQFKQCLIFCNYQVRVGELHRMLVRDKWPAEQLYGQQEQTDRLDALKTLQEYKCRILVSTDLAARGIDASNVDVVINFEPPYEWQTYLHRIGRAGRYGSYGTAISILSEGKEETKFRETLGITNIPFDLQYLWDDDPFNLSLNLTDDAAEKNHEPVIVPSNTKSENEHQKYTENLMWKVLTTESFEQKNDKKQEISSFEGLCESFKMSSEAGIERFSELMQSFSATQNKVGKNKDNFEYKHVHVAKLPIENVKYWNNLEANYTYKISDLSNDDVSKSKIKPTIIADGEIIGSSVNGEEPAQNERHLTESMENTHPKLISNCKDNIIQIENPELDIGEGNVQESVKPQNFQSKQNDNAKVGPMQALIEAGLPTAFGKTKLKKNTSHNYNSKSENTKLERSKTQYRPKKALQQKKENKEIKEIDSNTTFVKKYNLTKDAHESNQFKSCSDTNEISEQSDSCSKNRFDLKPTSKLRNNYAKYASRNETYCHQNESNKYNSSLMRSKQFDLWYKQLKQQMHFVQYALYVEELKKQ